MVNDKLIQWIKTEEAQGYTEPQLRQALKQQGYADKDIEDAFNSGLSLHEFISHKGKLFMVILYVMLFFFVLGIIGQIGAAVFTFNLLGLMLPTLMLGLVGYYLVKRKLYSLLVMMFIFTPFMFLPYGILSLLQSFVAVPDVAVYLMVSVHSVLIGLIIAFMFYKASPSFGKMVVAGVLFMSVIAAFSGIDMVVNDVSAMLSDNFSSVGNVRDDGVVPEGSGLDLLSIFNAPTYNSFIGFILSFTFFVIPWVVFYMKREDRKWLWMLLYIVPVLVFFAVYFGITFIAESLMPAVSI